MIAVSCAGVCNMYAPILCAKVRRKLIFLKKVTFICVFLVRFDIFAPFCN